MHKSHNATPEVSSKPLESDPTTHSLSFGRDRSDVMTSPVVYYGGGERSSSPATGIPLYGCDPPFSRGSVELQGEYGSSGQSAPSSATRSLLPASQQSGRMQPCVTCGRTRLSIASSMGSPQCGGVNLGKPPLVGSSSAVTTSSQQQPQQLTAFELRVPSSQTPVIHFNSNQHHEGDQSSGRGFSHPELEEGAGSSYEMIGVHLRSPTSITPRIPNNPLSLLSGNGGRERTTIPRISTQQPRATQEDMDTTAIVSLTGSLRNTSPTSPSLGRALVKRRTRGNSITHDSASTARVPKNTLSVSGCAAIVMLILLVGSLMGVVGAVVVLCSPVAEYPPRSSLMSPAGHQTLYNSLNDLTQTIYFNRIVTNATSSVHFRPLQSPCPYFGLAFVFRVASLVSFSASALGAASCLVICCCLKKRDISKRAQMAFIFVVGTLLVLGCVFGAWSLGLTAREGCGPAQAVELHVVTSVLGITIPAFLLLIALLGYLLGSCPSRRSLSVQIVTLHRRRARRAPQQAVV